MGTICILAVTAFCIEGIIGFSSILMRFSNLTLGITLLLIALIFMLIVLCVALWVTFMIVLKGGINRRNEA